MTVFALFFGLLKMGGHMHMVNIFEEPNCQISFEHQTTS